MDFISKMQKINRTKFVQWELLEPSFREWQTNKEVPYGTLGAICRQLGTDSSSWPHCIILAIIRLITKDVEYRVDLIDIKYFCFIISGTCWFIINQNWDDNLKIMQINMVRKEIFWISTQKNSSKFGKFSHKILFLGKVNSKPLTGSWMPLIP